MASALRPPFLPVRCPTCSASTYVPTSIYIRHEVVEDHATVRTDEADRSIRDVAVFDAEVTHFAHFPCQPFRSPLMWDQPIRMWESGSTFRSGYRRTLSVRLQTRTTAGNIYALFYDGLPGRLTRFEMIHIETSHTVFGREIAALISSIHRRSIIGLVYSMSAPMA